MPCLGPLGGRIRPPGHLRDIEASLVPAHLASAVETVPLQKLSTSSVPPSCFVCESGQLSRVVHLAISGQGLANSRSGNLLSSHCGSQVTNLGNKVLRPTFVHIQLGGLALGGLAPFIARYRGYSKSRTRTALGSYRRPTPRHIGPH
jgi:hypothetical protein